MKSSLDFSLEDPNNNSGQFAKTLELEQWMDIRSLVMNTTGSPISWHVESWDALGRNSQTDVMNFSLVD